MASKRRRGNVLAAVAWVRAGILMGEVVSAEVAAIESARHGRDGIKFTVRDETGEKHPVRQSHADWREAYDLRRTVPHNVIVSEMDKLLAKVLSDVPESRRDAVTAAFHDTSMRLDIHIGYNTDRAMRWAAAESATLGNSRAGMGSAEAKRKVRAEAKEKARKFVKDALESPIPSEKVVNHLWSYMKPHLTRRVCSEVVKELINEGLSIKPHGNTRIGRN